MAALGWLQFLDFAGSPSPEPVVIFVTFASQVTLVATGASEVVLQG